MNKRKYIVICFVIVMTLSRSDIVFAEKVSDINSTITTMMEKIQNKQEPNMFTDEQLRKAEPNIVLSILAIYEESPFEMVKRTAYQQEFRLAYLRPTPAVRQKVVERFVKEFVDPNPTINISPYPYGCLLKFRAEDFSPLAKEMLRQNLNINNRRGRTVMLIGTANIQEELPRLKKLLIDEVAYQADPNRHTKWYHTLGWKARLARARMGVKEDIDNCIKLADMELKGKPPRILHLFHDIGYIRQPGAIDFLMTYVFSDERLSQVKPTAPGEPVASYVMGILVDCLEDFPIKKREQRGYSQEDIELCRKWMSEQKEWKIIR